MKYALIGCGRIAVNHVKAVVNNNLDFVAACDIVPENIDVLFDKTNYADRDKVARYADYKDMIARHPDLELIAIATPSGVHAEIALYCIDHGINLIIEKPMATGKSRSRWRFATVMPRVDANVVRLARIKLPYLNKHRIPKLLIRLPATQIFMAVGLFCFRYRSIKIPLA